MTPSRTFERLNRYAPRDAFRGGYQRGQIEPMEPKRPMLARLFGRNGM